MCLVINECILKPGWREDNTATGVKENHVEKRIPIKCDLDLDLVVVNNEFTQSQKVHNQREVSQYGKGQGNNKLNKEKVNRVM